MTARTELLAPAGDIEAGYAALYYGADAVYLGLQKFSARATAVNFNEEILNEFTAYAHSLNRKVYAAINTLVQEDELDDLVKTLDICSRCKIDAVIIQDLGVARVIRDRYPELEMHASTQMAVHNKEGALALQKIGFSRVVIARELKLTEIEEIAAIPNLETEAFIHGALCYSYSGLCLLSSMETGKSANRGKCLYPCRAEFTSADRCGHFFSMKDLALQEEVLKMPVTSLKIEGRKKTALYVAATTDYYRRILDGKGADKQSEENIKQIFSRPWTKFHFNGKNKEVIDRDFVGHRGLLIGKIEQLPKGRLIFKTTHHLKRYDGMQIDIPGEEKPFGFSVQRMRVNGKNVFEAEAGDVVEIILPSKIKKLEKGFKIYLSSATDVKGAYPYRKPKPAGYRNLSAIDVKVEIGENAVKAACGDFDNEINGVFAPASNPLKMEKALNEAFAKIGNKPFELNSLEIINPLNLFVPVSILNELRRGLYDKIIIENKKGNLPDAGQGRVRNVPPQWVIKTDDLNCLAAIDINEVDEIVWQLNLDSHLEDIRKLPKNKVRISLPAVCRHPKKFLPLIEALSAQGYKKWEIGNYWGKTVLPETGIDLSFDASLYMMNTQAIAMAKEMGASKVTGAIEDTLPNLLKINEKSSLPLGLVIYQDVPLFTSANCIRSNSCKDCLRGETWFNLERGDKKYRALSKDCQIMLFAEKPFCMAAEARLIETDFYRVDFCYKKYTVAKAAEIWECIRCFKDITSAEKGNLARNML